MMRLTSKASDKSIALLSRVDASIILATAHSNHGVEISNCLSRHIVVLVVVDAGGKQTDGYDKRVGRVNLWRLANTRQ